MPTFSIDAAYPESVSAPARMRDRSAGVGSGVEFGAAAGHDLLGAAAGEGATASGAALLGQELQRLDGEVVVGVRQPGPAGLGQQVHPGRTAAAARGERLLQPGADGTLGLQCVEMPPDAGRATAEASSASAAAVIGPCDSTSCTTASRVPRAPSRFVVAIFTTPV